MNAKVKVAIAVSGKGRSLENLLTGDHPFAIGAVICSNPKAGAVAIAESHGLPLYHFDAKALDPQGLEAFFGHQGLGNLGEAGPRFKGSLLDGFAHGGTVPQVLTTVKFKLTTVNSCA